MGADVTRSTVQALGLHDLRITTDSIWAAESSYTQEGATAGDPVDQGSSEMDLYATGDMTDDAHLEIVVSEPGMPGPGRARFYWRESTSGNYYGHVQYLPLVAPWEAIRWTDGPSGLVRFTSTPQSVTLSDDTVSTVVQATYVDTGTTYRVLSYQRAPETPWGWSAVTVYQQDVIPTDGFWPCQLVLADGRALCAHWIEDTTNNLAQVRIHYSDDDGATWAVYSKFALPEAIDVSGAPGVGAAGFELGKLRMAELNGQVSLIAGLVLNNTTPAWREQQNQYASDDEGISFELVEEFLLQSNGSKAKAWDMVATDTTILVCNANSDPDIRRLGSADEPLSVAERVTPSITPQWVYVAGGPVVLDGDLSICVDEAGTLYVHGKDTGAASQNWCSAIRSTDDGATWTEPGISPRGPGTWWDAEDGATHPRDWSTTVQRARVVLCHNWDANPGNEDNSLGVFYLGGYSDLTLPELYSALNPDQDFVSWARTWLPFDTPDAVGWTAAGAGTAALTSGALNIATVAQQLRYTRTTSGTVAQGLIVRAVMVLNGGGNLASDDVAVQVNTDDGAEDYSVSIRFDVTGFRVYDNNAAATVGTASAAPASGLEFIFAIDDGSFACWYRGTDTDENHDWKAGPASTTLTDGGGTVIAANNAIWGHINSATADSDWTELQYSFAANTGQQLATGFTNPADLSGREFSATGTLISQGVTVAAADGPAIIADEWHIDTAYRYAVENLLAASPRRAWRSTAHNQIETIALALDDTLLGTAESMPGNDLIQCTILGTNVRNITLQGYDVGTASWVTLVDMTADEDRTGLHWDRRGNTVIPANTSGTDTPYLLHNDFQGGTFAISATVLRKIASQTEGRFGPPTAKRTTLVLDGVTGGEAANGTAGQIWAPRMCGIFKADGERYAGYRLRIPSQATVDGYYEIGRVLVGPCAVFGTLPDWGRAVELNHGTEQRVARDRTRSARKIAPHQRTLEITLVDSIDQTEIWNEETPDYLYGSDGGGKLPVSSLRDTPYMLEGIDRYLDGPLNDCVYIPTIKVTGTTAIFTSRYSFIPLAIDSPIRLETVLGEENDTEVLRVAIISGAELV
ncbi:hypothetical protein CMI37_16040 [Candidatus Pacearchaeota archaeon]|nr:hypothetical protein [Candidatus Pacearchaeota archaeon]